MRYRTRKSEAAARTAEAGACSTENHATHWTAPAWTCLCLLAATSAALPFTPLWFVVGPVVQGVAILLFVIFALVIVIADYSSSAESRPSSGGSLEQSGSCDERR